jgi:N-methylhydantoinase A
MRKNDRNLGSIDSAKVADREVFFDRKSGLVSTPVYDRTLLCPGHKINGPAIIDQLDSTTVLHPGQNAIVDDYSNLIITP